MGGRRWARLRLAPTPARYARVHELAVEVWGRARAAGAATPCVDLQEAYMGLAKCPFHCEEVLLHPEATKGGAT